MAKKPRDFDAERCWCMDVDKRRLFKPDVPRRRLLSPANGRNMLGDENTSVILLTLPFGEPALAR